MKKLLDQISGIVCIFTIVLLLAENGFRVMDANTVLFELFHSSLTVYFVVDIILRVLLGPRRLHYLLTHPTDWAIIAVKIQSNIASTYSINPVNVFHIILITIVIGRLSHIQAFFKGLKLDPTQMLIVGFGFAIFIGSILLSLPIATADNSTLNYIDAIFMATSAICVTGLSTINIGQELSGFGQTVILCLFQIGGLGIMSLSALFALFISRKFSQKESQEFQQSYATNTLGNAFKLLFSIFKITFIVELIGALIIFSIWHTDFDTPYDALYNSIFLSISAFCNAGFTLFSNSLAGYIQNIPLLITVAILIIIGGLGFPVIYNLINVKSFSQLRLQSKLAIAMTVGLIVFGTLGIFFTEYNRALLDLDLNLKVTQAFFNSVTARTAGFNTIDIAIFSPATITILIGLMFIGACPGSTGGGIKTTTFGVILAAFWNNIMSRGKVEIFGRTIPIENSLKALSITILSSIIIFLGLIALLSSELHSFLSILFETISAFATVGLSMGITGDLSNIGKLFIMVLMFMGRVGPLTIAFALSIKRPKTNYAYPEEKVLIT
jgi:trk system potassium uptake protein TrkH